ncbi:codanin-1-like [Notothenia coriiceps]|uniref:Codanin-1-like n=1 Tax=Notothenia coriiceps TaxID=8208 RepID=A0A6I9NJ81_9TELE|nr:PREDICTED: codanin-1-like [Notothenia coriiceps]
MYLWKPAEAQNVFFCIITENLVPNIFLELFFVVQLLTSRSPHTHDEGEQGSLCVGHTEVLERSYLRQVHNCVYFAVKVLESQFQLVSNLDKCTLRLLAENERVASFSPDLRDLLTQAQEGSTAKLSLSVSTFIHSVPFQPATDNRSNFGSDRAFHIFKKQRDIFYEVLREWEDYHKEPGWSFDVALGSRIRGMMSQLTSAGNHSHFARLFLKQLVQMCKGPSVNSSPGDTADADLLGMLGADSLGRLKRLEERLIQPQGVAGPCPPPSFPGHQEFFRDFLQAASWIAWPKMYCKNWLPEKNLGWDEAIPHRSSPSMGWLVEDLHKVARGSRLIAVLSRYHPPTLANPGHLFRLDHRLLSDAQLRLRPSDGKVEILRFGGSGLSQVLAAVLNLQRPASFDAPHDLHPGRLHFGSSQQQRLDHGLLSINFAAGEKHFILQSRMAAEVSTLEATDNLESSTVAVGASPWSSRRNYDCSESWDKTPSGSPLLQDAP